MDEKEEWGARAKLFTPEIKKLRLQIKVWEKWNKDIKNDISRTESKVDQILEKVGN